MFTGIVEELGVVVDGGPRLRVACSKVADDSGPGASVAVNGVCLTVVDRAFGGKTATLAFDVSAETAARTALGSLGEGDPVNLERPVTLLSRLGGHLVQGHVDGVATVREVKDASPGKVVEIEAPDSVSRYVVEKGSVAVDGVSLTVVNARDGRFGVALVPYTLDATTLGTVRPGDRVNLEVDVVAKYVEGLIGGPR
jgi:riboflavin synthase